MARRDNLFLVVAAGLAYLAWKFLKPQATAAADQAALVAGGGVTGSPHQTISSAGAQEVYNQMKAGWGV
jgi:hypothetical protein